MAEVTGLGTALLNIYQSFLSTLPSGAKNFINLFMLALLVFMYSVLVWKFYRFIARKNILELNLKKYSKTKHPLLGKLFGGFLYFIEYIIILPVLVFAWFVVFTIFLLLLTENLGLQTVLVISAIIIAAIRMTAYYKEDLSRDLAKLLPFTLLGVFLTTSGVDLSFEQILTQVSGLSLFLKDIFVYLAFVIVIEFVLRIFEVMFTIPNSSKKKETKTN